MIHQELSTQSQTLSLVVRRTIHATAEHLFAAWTQPAHLKQWWGPDSVTCKIAEINLCVGGHYRIANEFPDGKLIWITGQFEQIIPPRKLIYTWRIEPNSQASERVTVRFEPQGDMTEVVIIHERIVGDELKAMHEKGWKQCLNGLVTFLKITKPSSLVVS